MRFLLLAFGASAVLADAGPHDMLRSYLEGLAHRQIAAHRKQVAALKMGNIALMTDVRTAYAYALQAYDSAGAAARFRIGLRRESEAVQAAFPELR